MNDPQDIDIKDAQGAGQLDYAIQSPGLDPDTLKASRKAIRDGRQAWSIFTKLKGDNKDRNAINAEIAERYKGQQPFLDNEIQVWQSNFPTLFLAGIIDRVVPALTGFIEQAKVLTQSKLKDESPLGQRKSARLQVLFTKYVRRWCDWRSFCASLCQEVVLIGYAFAIRTDPYDWHPRFYRQDEAYVPEGTPQSSERVQVIGIGQDFLIHELTEIIQDREVARAAKWNVENVVNALNLSLPSGENTGDESDNERKWADAVREGNLGASFSSGGKVVRAAHVLAIETAEQGKVSHLIVDRERTQSTLLEHEMQFKEMRDVVTLFTLEPGNGKFYGSKGLGRMLVNFSIAIDVAVNETVNQLRIAGLIPVQVDTAKGSVPVRMSSPFLEITAEAKQFGFENDFPANITAAIKLIDQLQKIAEIAAQQYIPNTLGQEGGAATATEKRIDYTRELQSKAAFISRFAGQFAELMGMMQRGMGYPDTNDPEAMLFREEALGKGKQGDKDYIPAVVTEEELQEWLMSPAAETLQDLTQGERSATVQAANDPEIVMSPMIDQKARLQSKLDAMVPGPLAEAWMKKDAIDPNDEVEQVQKQIGEDTDILRGASVPVAPRDNDKVHMDWTLPGLMKGIKMLGQRMQVEPLAAAGDPNVPEALDHFNAALRHVDAHVQNWAKKGAQKGELAPYAQAAQMGEDQIVGIAKQIGDIHAHVAKAQQSMQEAAANMPPADGSPPAPPDGSTGAPPPPAGPPPAPGMPERIATAWIAQYPNLKPAERDKLEELTGLKLSGVPLAPPPDAGGAMPPPPPAPAGPPPEGPPSAPSGLPGVVPSPTVQPGAAPPPDPGTPPSDATAVAAPGLPPLPGQP